MTIFFSQTRKFLEIDRSVASAYLLTQESNVFVRVSWLGYKGDQCTTCEIFKDFVWEI